MSSELMKSNENGEFIDDARVEIGLVGPWWSPIIRFRFYMDHKPNAHLTVWHVAKMSKYLGTYTPPAWFLKLIGEAE